uniref:Uncharacterized protein n=1 Tax=Tetraselmis sp. GSL018 TaxID=582737 RepID=A0A061RTJ0_9CHLO
MKRHGVFFFGMSEGAVVLSSFNDEMYSDIIRGRIICGYSCEQNYWNYNRPEDAGIAGSPWIPTLNLMGYVDEFFGYQDSVAATVARCGEYPPILGNAFDAMVAVVAHLEGGRHALTWTHDDVIRELLSDFLERPQFVCRQLPHLWSHVKALQDEITRVRRSADNCVTYVRIRPPAPDAVISQNENEDVRSLLSKLNRRLYQLATDQPVSPMSDGGGLGRSFSELTSDMGEPVSSPVSNSVEESLRRSITTTMGTLNGSTKKAAAHVARVMCHVVDSKFSGVESGEPSSNPGTEPRKVKFAEANVSNVSKRPASLEIPKTCSATDLVLDGHSVQHHSQRGDARDNHEESGTAHSTPAIGTADSQRSSFDQPQLPKLILNSELTAAAQPGNKTLERSSHKQLSIFNSRPMSPEPEQPSSASRVSQWMEQTFQDPGYGPGDQAYQVWNKTEHERDLPVADRCRNERHGKQITERSNANHSSRTRTVWETEVLQHVREIFASQAEASTKTQQAISAMAEATSTVAISCAISSGVAAVSLAFLAFFGLSQSKR